MATDHPAEVAAPPPAVILHPAALARRCADLVAALPLSPTLADQGRAEVINQLGALRTQWAQLWQRFGATEAGWTHFRQLVARVAEFGGRLRPELTLTDGRPLREAVADLLKDAVQPAAATPLHLQPLDDDKREPVAIGQAVFLIGAPRAGLSALFAAMQQAPNAISVGGDGAAAIESVESLRAAERGFGSERLTADDLTPDIREELQAAYGRHLRGADGAPVTSAQDRVLVDRTLKNALRVPLLAELFPGARFVFVGREPLAQLASMLDAWRSGSFVSHEKLPEWRGGRWSFPLVEGWRDLEGKPLVEVAAAQLEALNTTALDDLAALPAGRATYTSLEALEDTGEVARLFEFAGLQIPTAGAALEPVLDAAPRPVRWIAEADTLTPLTDRLDTLREALRNRAGLQFDDPTERATKAQSAVDAAAAAARQRIEQATRDAETAGEDQPSPGDDAKPPSNESPAGARPGVAAGPQAPIDPRRAKALSSTHTKSLAQILNAAGISLVVSTYQAGQLVIVRADGELVNTNFKGMRKPMGIAFDGRLLAVGTATEVQTWQAAPAVAKQLQPAGRVDAAWTPRATHVTGNIDIHEMAYGRDGLWIVNTRFGCLATLDAVNSFVPRWRPPFLSALAAEDRCHLNGLAMVDGEPRYVTMLGQTDTAGGWRENKASGGLIMDIRDNRVVIDGLSMPHSPRVHDGKLWVLESGNGGLCTVDPASGAKETWATLPGFTRGLDFFGPFAFIGLSQVRESAVFAKLPLTERLTERICGVWVVHLERREIVAFLRFEEAVQEIFSVQVLPGARFPELVLPGEPIIANAFILPDEALRDLPKAQTQSN